MDSKNSAPDGGSMLERRPQLWKPVFDRMVELRLLGYSQQEIAEATGYSRNVCASS
jgi:hypothetical protein